MSCKATFWLGQLSVWTAVRPCSSALGSPVRGDCLAYAHSSLLLMSTGKLHMRWRPQPLCLCSWSGAIPSTLAILTLIVDATDGSLADAGSLVACELRCCLSTAVENLQALNLGVALHVLARAATFRSELTASHTRTALPGAT